jgi:hypothetical protein
MALYAIAACSDAGQNAAGPNIPGNPPEPPTLARAAFVFYVNTASHDIRVAPPTVTVPNPSAMALSQSSGLGGPDFSLIAGDVITLTASNYSASAVGAFAPGKIRVQFDLSITNKLGSVDLITPTFPAPPPGVSGILMFPFATYVTVTSGGVTVGGGGDSLIIELPNTGQVAPSIDWERLLSL